MKMILDDRMQADQREKQKQEYMYHFVHNGGHE